MSKKDLVAFGLDSSPQSLTRLTKFQEFMNYPQIITNPGSCTSGKVAEFIIHKVVNLHGGYRRIERRFNPKDIKKREKDKQFFTI